MPKKIFAFVLAVMLITGMKTPAEAVRKESLIETQLLNFMGIDTDSEQVTRMEYLSALVCMWKESAEIEKDNIFTDIKNENERKIAAAALNRKVIAQAEKFNPQEKIEYYEAIKMSVCALGYGETAEYEGGWPLGYLKTAQTVGILDGVSPEMTASDARHMLYNTFNAPLLNIKTVSENSTVKYDSHKNITMLSEYMDIHKGKGLVTANNHTALTKALNERGSIEIDYKSYKGKINGEALLGTYADFYYRTDKDGADTLVCMAPNARSEMFTVSTADIERISKSEIKYLQDGKTKKAELSEDLKVIYNGKARYDKSPEILAEDADKITLVSNDESTYSVIFIEKYSYMIADAVNADSIKGKCTNQYVNIREAATEYSGLSGIGDIKKGDAIAVSESADKTLVRIKPAESIEGYVTQMSDSDIVISGEKYKTSKNFNIEQPEAGKAGIFIINDFGEISWFESGNEETYYYALMIKCAGKTDVSNNDVEVKLLNYNGREEVYNVSGKAVVDGARRDDIYTYLQSKTDECAFIRYRTNGADELSVIDTAAPYEETEADSEYCFEENDLPLNNKLMCCYKGGYKYKPANTFAPAFHITDNTLIIGKRKYGDEFKYSLIDKSYFQSNKEYEVYAYDVDCYGAAGAMVCLLNDDEKTYTSAVASALVLNVSKTLDNDGNEVYSLYTFINGGYETVVTLPEVEPIKSNGKLITKGDIVRYNKDADGKVRTLICDFNAETLEAEPGSTSLFADEFGVVKYSFGSIYSINSDYYALVSCEKDPFGNYLYGRKYFKNYSLKYHSIMKFSRQRGTFKKISFSDIKDYRTAGENADKVLLRQYDFSTNFVIIYE